MDFSKVHHIAIIGTDFEEMKELKILIVFIYILCMLI